MLARHPRKATYSDYARTPEGSRYQLIAGELQEMTGPTPEHQSVVGRLFAALHAFAGGTGAGEVFMAPLDVYFSEHETYQPDIIFIGRDRLQIVGEKKIEGAPDLVMEVLSPSTAYFDLRHKKNIYEAAGVREYWIVDPMERSIEIHENEGGAFGRVSEFKTTGIAKSAFLAGFSVDLAELFG